MGDTYQISARIPRSVQRRLKAVAAREGTTVQEILSSAIDQFIAAHDSTQAKELREAIEAAR